jgi:hypothetical protein
VRCISLTTPIGDECHAEYRLEKAPRESAFGAEYFNVSRHSDAVLRRAAFPPDSSMAMQLLIGIRSDLTR